MAKDKSETFALIVKVARDEFLTCGYEKASIRKIAKQVGIVPSAIYKHFKDKEALFSYFVEPVLQEYDLICEQDLKGAYELLERNEVDAFWGFSDEQTESRIRFIYKYFDAFKLLLTCSADTKYSGFQHTMVEKDVQSTMAIWRHLKNHNLPVRNVDEQDLHLITSGFFSSMFELIIHDYPEDEAIRRSQVLSIFFNGGLKCVLGL
ncbi:MAG: TetR/AcrR family transcriptional regulator [Oscillospiraceae bacterium]|nr:TetR/AcrR family transcriptional regulator [Oscillospiraceae bacterium]